MATAGVRPHELDIFDTVLIPEEDQFSGSLKDVSDPVTVCFGLAAQELMRRPFEFKPQEIKDVLWSFSTVRTVHFPGVPFVFVSHLFSCRYRLG